MKCTCFIHLVGQLDTIAVPSSSTNGQRYPHDQKLYLMYHGPGIADNSRCNIVQQLLLYLMYLYYNCLAIYFSPTQTKKTKCDSPCSPDITSHNTKSCREAEKQVERRPAVNLKQPFECAAQTTCPWLEPVCGTMCWQQLISGRSLGQAESSPTVTGCNELFCQSLHTTWSCVLAAHNKQGRDCLLQDCGWFQDQDGGHTDVWVPEGFV